MVECPKCHKQLEDGTKFCDNCGAQVFETIFCPNCGAKTSTQFAFCQSCGASIQEDAPAAKTGAGKAAGAAAGAAGAAAAAAVAAAKNKVPKKWLMFGGIAVAAIVVIVLISSLLGGGGSANYGLYIKDDEIFYSNLSKDDPLQVTSRLVDSSSDVSEYELAAAATSLSSFSHMSEDGKLLFFPDRVDDSGVTLYYRDVTKASEEGVKIDSAVTRYAVNEKATTVTYLKDGESLYQYDIKSGEKNKIKSDVSTFYVSDDGSKIIFRDTEGDIYSWAGGEEEKLDSEVTTLYSVAKDLSKVTYIKEGSLYQKADGQDKVKIDSDVSSVLCTYTSGEVYYLKSADTEISLMDYVTDDMKAADDAMTQPERPEYPYSFNYDTYEEYEAAYDKYQQDYEAYQEAYTAYREKVTRDNMRESLSDRTLSQTQYSLYYFNGTESTLVTDAFCSDDASASDSPLLVFEAYEQSSVDKVKLSEISSIYDVQEMVEEALFSSTQTYVAVGATMNALDQDEASSFTISDDGSTIYFISDVSDSGEYGDLYKVAISDGAPQAPELYDNDVYPYAIYFLSDGRLCYYKDVKESKGELFLDKTSIDYDVQLYSVSYDEDSEQLLYFVDWSDDRSCGTLKRWTGKEAEKIADDVHDFSVTADGKILYLYDYSTNSYRGELYLFDKEGEKIDDDVVAILTPYSNKYHSIYEGIMGGGF